MRPVYTSVAIDPPARDVDISTWRAIREERGISQVQLAEATGFEQSWISRVERGTRTPTWQNVVRLAEGLGVGAGELAARAEASTAADGDPLGQWDLTRG